MIPKLYNNIKNLSNNSIDLLITMMNDAFDRSYNSYDKFKLDNNSIDDEIEDTDIKMDDCDCDCNIVYFNSDFNDILPLNHYNLRSDDKIEVINKFEFIQPSIAELEERIDIRNRFVNELFKHNNNCEFLDYDKFWIEQCNDGELNLIIQYLERDMNLPLSDQFKLQLNKLRRDNMDLYKLLKDGKLQIQTNKTNKNKLLIIRKVTELDNKVYNRIVVPAKLRGKLVLFAHHNVFRQHFGQAQTYDNLESKFWWQSMRKDVNEIVKGCVLCQFTKGGVSVRAPLLIRDLPAPRSHIMIDFLGPIYNHKYYILVIVDYGTGYTMLVPTDHCDTIPVVDTLLSKWIPFLGLFKVIESDFGAQFNAKLVKQLLAQLQCKQLFSETNNHMGTGKVERTIGFVQQIINSFNVELNGQFVQPEDPYMAWQALKLLLPFIQFSINQKRSRFTGISPHMLLFGTNLDEIEDIKICTDYLSNILEKQNSFDTGESARVKKLVEDLEMIHNQYEKEWRKYMLDTKEIYDKKYNIHKYKYTNKHMYKPGNEVVYYVGDRKVVGRKWRQRWSGPWKIIHKLNERTLVIGDNKLKCKKTVSINRCKQYNSSEFIEAQLYNRQLIDKVKLDKNKLKEFEDN